MHVISRRERWLSFVGIGLLLSGIYMVVGLVAEAGSLEEPAPDPELFIDSLVPF